MSTVSAFLLRPSRLVPAVLLLGLAAVPLVASALDEPFWVSFFTRVIIYAIAASALNLALGLGGLVSFGHALFLGLGSYAVALPAFHEVGNGWVHVLICLMASGAVALGMGMVSMRTAGMGFIMITLAFAQMGYFLFVSLKMYGGDDGLPIAQTSRFGPFDLSAPLLLHAVAWLVLAGVTVFVARLREAPYGVALRASRQNARRVNAIGLETRKLQLVALVLSGMLCGVAGLLLANLNAFASPSTMSWSVSGDLIVMVVLGGTGTVFGPLVGALAFIGLEEALKSVTEHWLALFGPLIVIMALAGRRGLMGLLQQCDACLLGRPPALPSDPAAVPPSAPPAGRVAQEHAP